MGLTRFSIRVGSWILLSYLLCQHVLVMGLKHHRVTRNEETVKSELQSSAESESVPNATLSQATEQNNKTSENFLPLPPGETVNSLLRNYLQEKLGDVTTNEALVRQPRHVRVTSYVLMLYSTMQEMDTMETGQEHIGQMAIPTIRSHKATYFTQEKSRWLGRQTRYLQFTVDQSDTANTTRCEIVVKLRHQRGMKQYNSFKLHVHLQDWEQYTARRYENFLIFDISSELSNLPKTFYTSQYLFAENTATGETTTVKITTRREEPVLVVYENMKENPLFKSPTRSRRDVNSASTSTATGQLENLVQGNASIPYEGYHCKRHDWTIDLNVFNWNWLLQPFQFNAGYCKGACPPPLASKQLNTTAYSFIKNLWRYKTEDLNGLVPKVCCTPVLYHPQSIMYIDKAYAPVIMTLPDAKVAACGCR